MYARLEDNTLFMTIGDFIANIDNTFSDMIHIKNIKYIIGNYTNILLRQIYDICITVKVP